MNAARLIRRYYDGCTAGDLTELLATLHPDVVHYFLAPNPGSAPVTGAEHLARYWRKVTRMLDARWVVDHILAGDDEAQVWVRLRENPHVHVPIQPPRNRIARERQQMGLAAPLRDS